MAARGRFTVPLSPFMSKAFAPSFQDFQKDIERCLQSKGQVEKNELGQTVYRGYQAVSEQLFRTYIDEGALAPFGGGISEVELGVEL
jgi:hypothetical protein